MALDVLDTKVELLIRRRARNIFGVPMEKKDIEQELRVAVIEYCNQKAPSERTRQAIAVTINRCLYKLIRENIQFEGCSERSKKIRQMLNRPYSLNQTVYPNNFTPEKEEDITLMGVLKSEVDTQSDQITLDDFVESFKKGLSETELCIFNLMLEGVNKPRFICEELYGHKNEKTCKAISKHSMIIKKKFTVAWREEYGKIINY